MENKKTMEQFRKEVAEALAVINEGWVEIDFSVEWDSPGHCSKELQDKISDYLRNELVGMNVSKSVLDGDFDDQLKICFKEKYDLRTLLDTCQKIMSIYLNADNKINRQFNHESLYGKVYLDYNDFVREYKNSYL